MKKDLQKMKYHSNPETKKEVPRKFRTSSKYQKIWYQKCQEKKKNVIRPLLHLHNVDSKPVSTQREIFSTQKISNPHFRVVSFNEII